jgi:hypothetical protein
MVLLVWGAVSLLCHFGLYRWLRAAFPTWLCRHRRGVLLAMAVACILPFGRGLVYPSPVPDVVSAVVGAAMAWQVALLVATIVLSVVRPIARAAARTDPSRRMLLERVAGAVIVGTAAGVLGWGVWRARRSLLTIQVPVRLRRLPKALDGFRIVQISDLHVGPFVQERMVAEAVDAALRLRPDLIAITGDMLDYDPRYIPLAVRQLSRLRAPAGVVCVLGNHDYYTGARLVTDAMRAAGIDVLVNRGKVVLPEQAGGFVLLGVDDLWAARTEPDRRPDLDAAFASVPKDRATVLLAHHPTYVREVIGRGVDLQLSGHTHGGQINLGFALARLAGPYVAGRYEVKGTTLYVNRGIGTVGPPARVGACAEVTEIVLVSS